MDSTVVITPELITGTLTALLSLLFMYFPILNTWFAGKTTEQKSLIMILGSLLIGAAIFLLGCEAWIVTSITCTGGGGVELLKIVFVAITANQVTYLGTKNFPPKKVAAAKANRNAPVG